ncbi:hypothetical protein ABZU75_43875 [Streptosporangium sp. NPDC005286]|uniref:hypothetical protein n=1 Tax=Streptosporangium sp. NPDC005286 TaxID=3154463 RepID=UPI0033BBBEE3
MALTGPGLTEDVDESALTANALWEAVTGKPGTQDWHDSVNLAHTAIGRSVGSGKAASQNLSPGPR